MRVIGLTGGVASGKSTVADAFSELGIEVIDTDELARDVVAPGSDGLAAVVAAFGEGVLDSHGHLDRRRLRRIVFDDDHQRERLESVLHPRIERKVDERLATARGPYVVLVVPLLVEKHWQDRVDRILVVDIPAAEQIRRLRARDELDQAQAQSMLDAQTGRDRRLAAADDIIDNTGDRDALRRQVRALDRRYRQPPA